MRRFVYGLLFGAAAMYLYEFHGFRIRALADSFAAWRQWAMEETRQFR
jgi:hypothetical protein